METKGKHTPEGFNAVYDSEHPPNVKVERKVSPTVQHISVKCDCREKTHRVTGGRIRFEGATLRYWCGPAKAYKEARFRRSA